ncbi:bifunctional nuclease 2 isoform X2 [Diospyros lotus]|uniref:bifunctional nuclease 2 isoform X2 n=1 Tax=Diospyros lotus TaxID=55363 RepID=UPI002251070F|nr:bifunctional nuclease 2 isoform X2 [Diospyros lotus]
MVGAQLCCRAVCGFAGFTDQLNAGRQIRSSLCHYSSSSLLRFSFRLGLSHRHCGRSKSVLICCKSSRSFGPESDDNGGPDHDYVEAFVLLSETIRHYRMRMQGFQEEAKWQSSAQSFPRNEVSSIGPAFLRHFQSPTIFLKISCDGDFLLPIIVGEFAIEKLIDSSNEDDSWDCPNQFQLVRNLVEHLGYRVTMVRITERVVNTYFARIFFSKPGENDILSVDARPSDAINVAKRCMAPIYVNKQIVLTDGFRIAYGIGRTRNPNSIYDVSLDRWSRFACSGIRTGAEYELSCQRGKIQRCSHVERQTQGAP